MASWEKFPVRVFDSRWNGLHGIGRFSAELGKRLKGFHAIGIGGNPAAASDPWRVGAYLRRVRPRLHFSPGYNAPLGGRCKFAFTVHDLNHLFIRENGSYLKRLYYSRILRPALFRAEVVFTVSEFSKCQILEWSGVVSDKVVVVRPGISEIFSPVGRTHSASRPYFLFVGSCKAHKNLARILRAFKESRLDEQFQLIATGTASSDIVMLLNQLEISAVQFIGPTSDAELASLYRGACGLIFTSIYEGFGLPIVESMACGTPVLTSNAASMPEVSGGAAILVDPYRVDEIAQGLVTLAVDIERRAVLRRLGLLWAQKFSWQSTSNQVEAEINLVD